MVRHSLVAKSLLYAAVVVGLSVPGAMWVGHLLIEQGRNADVRGYVGPMLEGAAHEFERTSGTLGPTSAQLADMSALTHHEMHFIPWSSTNSYPPELAKQRVIIDDRPLDQKPHHWVRIERGGAPVGALEVEPWSGRRLHPRVPGPPLFWGWICLLLVCLVPPLWIWVVRPLRIMTAVAQRLGAGDLETPVAITRRDEFGELEAAFEHMRVDLRGAMELKERLLTDVSHEIRGPLSRMTLALPLIRQQSAPNPILELFARELKAADELLEQVLELSRGRRQASLPREALDLAEIARKVVHDRSIVTEQKAFTLQTDWTPAPVLGNSRMLEIAMGNLLDNALKYTPVGGHLWVETRIDGAWVSFTVRDDGAGIAAMHLPQIFDPFYRPDDSRSRETGGSGLGLSIVRSIAEAHQGSALLHSIEGTGTTAEMRLPLAGPYDGEMPVVTNPRSLRA
jgi:signal transduction histidine kinase